MKIVTVNWEQFRNRLSYFLGLLDGNVEIHVTLRDRLVARVLSAEDAGRVVENPPGVKS